MTLSLLIFAFIFPHFFYSGLCEASIENSVGFLFLGRSDLPQPEKDYLDLVKGIDTSLASITNCRTFWGFLDPSSPLKNIESKIEDLRDNGVDRIFAIGHSMSDGGVLLQRYVAKNPRYFSGLILLSSFFQRIYRPGVAECISKWKIQPSKSLKYPLGQLKDGVHDCFGENKPVFPVPTLSIGGELDGLVRITRIAEAWYTQTVLDNSSNSVFLISGMNHANLISSAIPRSVRSKDLRPEISNLDAISVVSCLIKQFVYPINQVTCLNNNSTEALLDAIIDSFVEQEGNWWFTGNDEEHGASKWAANAQKIMAEPLPLEYSWVTSSEFHLLSDEGFIPPYYREQHRPKTLYESSSNTLKSTSIVQARYALTVDGVFQAGAGLNAHAVISEEKAALLQSQVDLGDDFVSAIELGTKLNSRQKIHNITGFSSPDSLDDGDRCKLINDHAVDYAWKMLPEHARMRFSKYGYKLIMDSDMRPRISAGPWWIWSYLTFNDLDDGIHVNSKSGFFPLDSNPYGAGNHYCKLLSPARAMEWMLVDGLRKFYGISAAQ